MQFMAEVTNRMLDRMASTRDFAEFIQSDAANTFLASLAPNRASASPQSGIFRTMQAGIVLTALGIGALVLDGRVALEDPALTIVARSQGAMERTPATRRGSWRCLPGGVVTDLWENVAGLRAQPRALGRERRGRMQDRPSAIKPRAELLQAVSTIQQSGSNSRKFGSPNPFGSS
jgi:hypothetical protein